MDDKRAERRGLGRGLSALMADVPEALVADGATAPPSADRSIPVEAIEPNPDQPRRDFTQEQLQELADSIREKGIIQPLILRRHPDDPDRYQIVAGERRWRAAQIAQLHDVPAVVRHYDDIEMLEVAIVENIQRADLNAMEEAAGYRQLTERFGHTQEKVAEALGKSRSHIANSLRLLSLPDDVQKMVRDGQLTAGHARALITSEDPSGLARIVVEKGLSVREAEKLAKRPKAANRAAPPSRREKDADTRALEQDLSAALGMTLRIDHAPDQESGKLTVHYRTLDELDMLCGALSAARR